MAYAQKPDFVFRRNGRVHLNRRGRQFSRLLAVKVCASALTVGSNAGYTMFRGSVKGIGYPLHSPVSPSLPLPCVTVCHHISTGVYYLIRNTAGQTFYPNYPFIRNIVQSLNCRSYYQIVCNTVQSQLPSELPLMCNMDLSLNYRPNYPRCETSPTISVDRITQ